MADRSKLITALRNAHNAGDTEAATRIAGMLKSSPEAPQAPQGATPSLPTTNTPTAPQEAVQSDSGGFTDTLKGMGRITAGVPVAAANVGVGIGNSVLSAADWAAEQMGGNIDYRIPAAGYGDSQVSKEYLTPQGTGEKIVSELPTYMIGGELFAPVKAAENAGRVSKFATSLLNQLPGSITGELSEHNQGDLSATNVAVNSVLPTAIEGLAKPVVKYARQALPEIIGGYSQAQKAANVVNPELLEKVYQGGNQEAQQAFRTATTDAQGNTNLMPSQVFNPEMGSNYIGAESRDMLRGENSVYNQRLAQQQTGEGLQQAVADTDRGKTLQSSAQDITAQFKAQANDLYNSSKQNAQDLLDSKRITSLKFPNTKNIAAGHLAQHQKLGVGLTGETRRTLQNFQKSKITSIEDLDQWKQALNEQAANAYRNGHHKSSQALRDVVNSLRGEADNVISRIDPTAGSIYRDADMYFAHSVGDFGTGKKSVLGKMAANESESKAANVLVGTSPQAVERANNAGEALTEALNSGSLNDAANLSLDFSGALGSATRSEALRVGSTGANFSPTKFANRLNQLKPQAQVATDLSAMVGGADESAVNKALADSVGLTRNKARNVNRVTDKLASVGGRVVGGVVGSTIGSVVPVAGHIAGAALGERTAKAIGEGVIDRILGTAGRSDKYINYITDTGNYQGIKNAIGATDYAGNAIAQTAGALGQSTYSNLTNPTAQPQYVPQAPVEAPVSRSTASNTQANPITATEPEQHAQSATVSPTATSDFDHKTTRLYKALANAETGGLNDRFIRTKAAESGTSTAYGAAQLTVTTAKDFYQRHSNMFNDQEKDYLHKFFDQGNKFKHADNNDPVYGYGGTGTLNGKEDRKLYARVVRKMLQQMIKDNNGSLDKTVKQWRGNNKDTAYFSKVLSAYKSA